MTHVDEAVAFSWNDKKSDECLDKRGFDFAFAARVFFGFHIERLDDRFDYGEPRYQVMGRIDGLLYAVVYTPRGNVRRIISARRAKEKEWRRWQR